ncbi:hypothetical protein I302_101138 [Kwoniella bestiolae CBS 10118]|uniref:Uncharacterized protein n=1 Tax=Kwoniella bestiolae CBS 10118 TaxID=1296100 RepID=A0A1B9G742_9TREE|nr:hypothetical protein I302_04513 [Kwoniella bestiolae CBS 10118]OCF26823.1 hypothetical protein I302_04513 [Kwoniella bestiolae CBS 10118]
MLVNIPILSALLALGAAAPSLAGPAPRCSTNAECLKRGLPLRAPSKRAIYNTALRTRQANYVPNTFAFTGAVNTFTAPSDGDYFFTVQAGSGGTSDAAEYTSYGGSAAQVNSTIFLTRNTVLNIVVGGQAGTAASSFGAGGGGGSFVYTTDDSLLIAAGGGGGAETAYPNPNNGRDANSDFSTDGTAGQTGIAGGTNGNGGSSNLAYAGGGGGAGFFSSGQANSAGSAGNGGSTKPSWAGGVATNGASSAGGFGGGGGGGGNGGGGGGGYSGGGGGGEFNNPGSGGGGSNYATPAGVDSVVSIGHTGNGVIIITQLNEAIP